MPSTLEVLNTEVESMSRKLNTVLTDLEPRIKNGEAAQTGVAEIKVQVNKISTEIAAHIDNIKALRDELTKRQDEFEAKAKEHERQGKSGAFKTVGQMVLEQNELTVKGWKDGDREYAPDPQKDLRLLQHGGSGRVFKFKSWQFSYAERMLMKTITSASGSGADLLNQMRVPGIVRPGEERLTIRDLLPRGVTAESSVEFVAETGHTDNAQIQAAQGDLKGESDLDFTLTNAPVRTIAHFLLVSTQMLADVQALQSYIDSRLRFFLLLEEENQLLLGDGIGSNISGLVTTATAYDTTLETLVTNVTGLDRIRLAMLQVQEANFLPDGIVLPVRQWAGLELTKSTDGAYMFVNPQNSTQPRLWGLPVVASFTMTNPNFMVGSFGMGAQLWDREAASVSLSTEDTDNFQRNLVTLRAEERLALTKYHANAFVSGSVTGGSGSGS